VKQVPSVVARIVEHALGATVSQSATPKGGAVAETHLLKLEGNSPDYPARVVCKIGSANIWTGSVIEPKVVRLVNQQMSHPVPNVLASGSVRGLDGTKRWALYEYRPGSVPEHFEAASYEPVVHQAGQLLGKLHEAFEFNRIGDFNREDDNLVLVKPSSKNLLARLPIDPESFQPVLAHGDYHPGNLLVENDSITTVLDWGNAHITDASYSLAQAETRFIDVPPATETDSLRESFRKGYEKYATVPENYAERFPLYRHLWLAQSAVNIGSVARTPNGRSQLRRQAYNWLFRQYTRLNSRKCNWS